MIDVSRLDPTLREVASAYQGVDELHDFPDAEAVRSYRSELLQRTQVQADFLSRRVRPGARALEVGCGNGRLLIALRSRDGAIGRSRGVDIASSRIEFARVWAAEEGVDDLEFDAVDALTGELGSGYEAVLCLTGALGYFGAADPRRDDDLLQRFAEASAPGGLLCLELYPHPRERRLVETAGGSVQLWKELGEDDPWRFYLSDLTLRGSRLTHRKTFVHRHDGRIDTGRSEALHLYTADEVCAQLAAAGFEAATCFEGWSDEPYAGGDVLVVVARRVVH